MDSPKNELPNRHIKEIERIYPIFTEMVDSLCYCHMTAGWDGCEDEDAPAFRKMKLGGEMEGLYQFHRYIEIVVYSNIMT